MSHLSLHNIGTEEEEEEMTLPRDSRSSTPLVGSRSTMEAMLLQMSQTLSSMDMRQRDLHGRVNDVSDRVTDVSDRVNEVTGDQNQMRMRLREISGDLMGQTDVCVSSNPTVTFTDNLSTQGEEVRNRSSNGRDFQEGSSRNPRVIGIQTDPGHETNTIAECTSVAPATLVPQMEER
jgi:hypothetical protein